MKIGGNLVKRKNHHFRFNNRCLTSGMWECGWKSFNDCLEDLWFVVYIWQFNLMHRERGIQVRRFGLCWIFHNLLTLLLTIWVCQPPFCAIFAKEMLLEIVGCCFTFDNPRIHGTNTGRWGRWIQCLGFCPLQQKLVLHKNQCYCKLFLFLFLFYFMFVGVHRWDQRIWAHAIIQTPFLPLLNANPSSGCTQAFKGEQKRIKRLLFQRRNIVHKKLLLICQFLK